MLNVGAIKEGFVLDHIKAGMSLSIYHDLKLDELDFTHHICACGNQWTLSHQRFWSYPIHR